MATPQQVTEIGTTAAPRMWVRRTWALFECVCIVIAFFIILVVLTEALPKLLAKAVPNHTFHFSGNEVGDQSAIRLVCFPLAAAFVAWACIRRSSRVAIGLQLDGWRLSIALIALPYALGVAGAVIKPGHALLGSTLAFLALGLSVATGEEVVFRGLVMHRLRAAGFSVTAVVILQALLFGLAHLPASGALWWTALPLAIFCGVARQYSGSLIGPILLHGTRGLFLSFMSDKNLERTIGLKWMTVLSVLWLIGFVAFEWRRKKSQSS